MQINYGSMFRNSQLKRKFDVGHEILKCKLVFLTHCSMWRKLEIKLQILLDNDIPETITFLPMKSIEIPSHPGPEFLALKHESRILGHPSDPVCGFSRMEQWRILQWHAFETGTNFVKKMQTSWPNLVHSFEFLTKSAPVSNARN